MKFAIIKVSNGNYFIHSEGITDVDNAKVQFHGLCQALWNASDVKTATVAIVNENFAIVENYIEHISHVQPTEEE